MYTNMRVVVGNITRSVILKKWSDTSYPSGSEDGIY